MKLFVSPKLQSAVLSTVRAKKELSTLSTPFILDEFNEQLRLDKRLRSILDADVTDVIKSKQFERIIKHIREKARKPYGVFIVPSQAKRRQELLACARIDDTDAINELLTCHISTKERAPHYAEFFSKLLAITGTPKSVLELACGLDPIAWYRHSDLRPSTHIVSDVSDLDCAQLQHWFDINDLPAKAVPIDLVKHSAQLSEAPCNQRFDMCVMLKTLDTLEYQKRYITYELLKRINSKWIIASFPLQSVRRVQMDRSAKINWFEKMLARCEMTFTTFEIPGEVVYVCSSGIKSKDISAPNDG